MKGSIKIITLTIIVMLTLLLCSCTEKRVGFTMYIDKVPDTLDPQLAVSSAEMTSALHLYNGLFRKSPSGKIEAEAAEDYTVSDDGLIYTITLKQDQYWHSYKGDNGKVRARLTANDFVFALQRVFTKATKSPYTSKFASISGSADVLAGRLDASELGVKAIDAYTLEIRLSQPDPLLIEKLCCAGAMPCNEAFFTATNGAYGLSGSTSLGNGDFALANWQRSSGIGMKKLVSTKGEVNYLRLIMPSDKDPAEPIERLVNEITDGELIRGYVQEDSFTSTNYATTVWTLCFNTAKAPFSNANIRAGLAASFADVKLPLDNKSLIPASGLVPPGITVMDKHYRDLAGSAMPTDYGNARDLYFAGLGELQKAQLNGITVLVPDTKPYIECFEEINQQWQKDLSCFYNVKLMPLAEIQELVSKGRYDIAMLPIEQDDNDVSSLLARFTKDSTDNICQYASSEYDYLLQETRNISGGAQQIEQYASAERLLVREAPIIPIFYETGTFVTAPWVNDVILSPYGPVIDVSYAYAK